MFGFCTINIGWLTSLVDSSVNLVMDPDIFHVRPHSMSRLVFCVVGKPFKKKKTVWSRHLFLFYFKREKQNKKENP